jgi:hypothetical protein
MISWTTRRTVDFEKVCSVSEAKTTEIQQPPFGVLTSRYTLSIGNTTNATGTTGSTTGSTVTSLGTSEGTETFSSTTSGFIIAASASIVTSTTQQYGIAGNVTSSSTSEGSEWTTRLNTASSTITEFVSTVAQQTRYFAQAVTTSTSSRLTTTQLSETTAGNAIDTVWLAEDTEALWVVNQQPTWSAAITGNAQSTTQTTLSRLDEVLALTLKNFTTDTASVDSSESTSSISFVEAAQTTISRTGVVGQFFSPGQTTEFTFSATTSSNTSSFSIAETSQPSVFHLGNTSTETTFVQFATTRSFSDIMASATWNSLVIGVLGTTSVVGSFDALVSQSTCSGSTTRTIPVLGGQTAIASQAQMSVYASNGAAIGESSGMRFTGGGFAGAPVDEDDDIVGPLGPRTARDGSSIYLATIFPITQGSEFGLNALTQESNSVTFVSTTSDSAAATTVTTTSSATVGVADSMWIAPVRTRANLLGGGLAPGETALMRIGRGLYEDQSGSTSFFEGNDTTYTGSMPTTYWLPVTYLTPAFGQAVFAVPRNTSTWPTA